jgi:hypothetical protein
MSWNNTVLQRWLPCDHWPVHSGSVRGKKKATRFEFYTAAYFGSNVICSLLNDVTLYCVALNVFMIVNNELDLI